MPQIRKYRRSLIEVLLASLAATSLAQPLVLQQIFDKVIGQQNLDTLYLGLFFLSLVCSKACLELLEHISCRYYKPN